VTVYTTIWSDEADFLRRVTVIDWRTLGWSGVARAMSRAAAGDVIIINGALGFKERWRDLLIACGLRLAGRQTRLVVSDSTWEPRSTRAESSAGLLWSANDRMARAMVRSLADERTVFCFLSTHETECFGADRVGPKARAVFTPFYTTVPEWLLDDDHLLAARGAGVEPYVFTGGNTLRDWDLLVEALGDCGVEVRVATRHTGRTWPPNFRVGPLSREDFFQVAAGATAGVLALRSDVIRSAGQQTYLNLLRLGVPLAINEAPGVRDHLEGIPGAFITGPHAAGEMRDRVTRLCDDANRSAIDAMTATTGQQVAERFSNRAYLMRLVAIADGM
jgi:hypothetical protein